MRGSVITVLGGDSGPMIPVLPWIEPFEARFVHEDGSPAVIKMASMFNAIGALYDFGEDYVKRVLEDWASIGATDGRIFTCYNLLASKIGRCLPEEHPDFYDYGYPKTVELMESFAIRPWPVAYTSWNDPLHWPALIRTIRGMARRSYISYINEFDQKANLIDPLNRMIVIEPNRMGVQMPSGGAFFSHERPSDLMWSQGSNGSQAPAPKPYGRWTEQHWNLAPEEPRKFGHNSAEVAQTEGRLIPVVSTETSRFPDGGGMWVEANTTHEQVAYDTPRGGRLFSCDGCFHSVLGKSFSRLDEQHKRIGKIWFSGADSIPLPVPTRFPEDYSHRRDREYPGRVWPTGLNRSYQMGTKPEHIADIHGTFIPDNQDAQGVIVIVPE